MQQTRSGRSPRFLAVLAALVSLSCEQVVVTTVDVDRLDVAPPTSFVRVSGTTPLTVTVLSKDGRALSGRTIVWSSADPAIADVDATGMVRGLTPGTATIRASTEGVAGSATVTVTSGPAIDAAPREIEFTAVQNGATPGDRTVTITNAGDGTLSGLAAAVTFTPGQPTGWLLASVSGAAPATLVLSARHAGLALGTYTATVAVTSPDASNSPVVIAVRLIVLAPQPAIALGATTASFAAPQGGADPSPQNVGITNAGGGTLTGLAATVAYTGGQPTGWLTASLGAGTAPTTLALRAATGSLPQGVYTATVQIASTVAQNSPQTVNVTFTVGAAQPGIGVNPPSLSFSAVKGGSNAATKTVQVTNTGGGSLSGLALSVTYPGGQPAGWITTSLSGTTAPATLTVGTVTGALDAGTYTATIRITAPDAANSPQSVEVSFQVQPPAPAIALSRTDVGFSTTIAGGDPSAQQVAITNAGGGTLSGLTRTVTYAAGEPTGWLTADLSATTAPATLTLTARVGSLVVGAYNARVQIASASASNSPAEIVVTFTIAATPPTAPGTPAAATVSDRRINVSWTDQSNNESRFDVERSTSALTGWTVIGTAAANQTTYADSTGLAGSTTYYYRVAACNAIGCTPNLAVVSATTAPNVPSNLAAAATTSTQVNLSWTDNSTDETGFPIERSSDGGQTWTVIATAPAGATAYGDASAAPVTTYRYRLRACRNTACSRYGTEAQVTTPGAPGAPGALTAVAASPSRIDLTWTDNSTNETQFRIEARTAAGSFAQVGTAAANTPSFAHTGVNAKTQYFYRVRACTATECSGYSAEASATTPPNPPTALTANPVSPTQVNLAWTAPPEGVTGYAIERRAGTGAYAALATVGTTPSYNDTNDVQPTTTYTYRVRACDNTNCSAFSNEASATTPAAPAAPAAPGAPAAATVSDRRINVSWTDQSSDESRFDVERSNNGNTGWTVIGTAAANGTTYADSIGLTGSTTYYHRVSACNTVGCTANPTVVSATTAPNMPSSLAATATVSTEVNLTWTDNSSDETGFPIERSSNGGQSWAALATAAAGTTAYSDATAAPGTTYRYRMRACRGTACSRYSSETQVTTPSAPGAPSALAAAAASPSQINLTWTDNSTNETQFRIEARTASGTFAQVGTAAANTPSFTHSGLNAKTQYFYRVRACTASECSSYSAEASATTLPNPPTALTASAPSPTQVDLAWTAPPEGVSGYAIERRVGGGSYTALATVAATSYNDTNNVQPATTYTYRVRACENTLCSAFSNEASATTPQAPPGAPSGLSATAVNSERIDLAWSASSGTVNWYRIERKNNTLAGAYAVVDSVSGGTRAYQSTGLTPLTSYSHRVQACNSAGCSDYSNETTTSTPGLAAPNAPANLAASATSATQISLTWTHDGLLGVTSFEIERAPSTAQSNFTPLASVAGSARSYVDGGLTSATSYYYRVRACNLTGCSAYSSVANAKTLSPSTPTNVSAVATSTSQVTVSWTPPGGQTYYQIRRRVNGTGTPTSITVSDANATSYLDSGLNSGTRYSYEVRACGPSSSCSSYSTAVFVTTQ